MENCVIIPILASLKLYTNFLQMILTMGHSEKTKDVNGKLKALT